MIDLDPIKARQIAAKTSTNMEVLSDWMAHVPSDIAALIAEVEALRSESLTMRQWAEEAAAAENANARELREARAEVARLRALLGLE